MTRARYNPTVKDMPSTRPAEVCTVVPESMFVDALLAGDKDRMAQAIQLHRQQLESVPSTGIGWDDNSQNFIDSGRYQQMERLYNIALDRMDK